MTLALAYALFNVKINGAIIGTNASPAFIEIFFLGIFIAGLYFVVSNRRE